MSLSDLVPSARETVYLLMGVFIGTFGLFLTALLHAASKEPGRG